MKKCTLKTAVLLLSAAVVTCMLAISGRTLPLSEIAGFDTERISAVGFSRACETYRDPSAGLTSISLPAENPACEVYLAAFSEPMFREVHFGEKTPFDFFLTAEKSFPAQITFYNKDVDAPFLHVVIHPRYNLVMVLTRKKGNDLPPRYFSYENEALWSPESVGALLDSLKIPLM